MADTTTSPHSLDDPLQAAIVGIVRQWDFVSFAELPRRLADAGCTIDTEGDSTIELPGRIVLWSGLSIELVDAILGLLHAEELFLHPTTMLTYLGDGWLLNLPLAKRPSASGYKQPRWLPCVLRLVPLSSDD